jgi:hypothetical protein
MEAQFYLLCHCGIDPATVARAIRALLAVDARLHWNIEPNLQYVRLRDPQLAALPSGFAQAMETGDDR